MGFPGEALDRRVVANPTYDQQGSKAEIHATMAQELPSLPISRRGSIPSPPLLRTFSGLQETQDVERLQSLLP